MGPRIMLRVMYVHHPPEQKRRDKADTYGNCVNLSLEEVFRKYKNCGLPLVTLFGGLTSLPIELMHTDYIGWTIVLVIM
jgi:hypothetical protein